MKSLLTSLLLIFAILAFGGQNVRAQDSTGRKHIVSIGLDPMYVAAGSLWAKAEIRISNDWSTAAHVAQEVDGRRESFGLLGGDVCWYPVGSFENGFQVIAHIFVSHDSIFFNGNKDKSPYEIPGEQLSVAYGLMLGYKYIATTGFTANLQVGMLRSNKQTRAAMPGYDEDGSAYIPWGYFNVGWSF